MFQFILKNPFGIYGTSWSLDRFEKMESGINFWAIDFIKIGSMVLRQGYWNQNQIINHQWLKLSTISAYSFLDEEYQNTFLENRHITYQYMWYNYPS